MFTSPNTAADHDQRPGRPSAAPASGMRATFLNAGSSLSIGIFFTLMVVGLAHTLPDGDEPGPAAAGRRRAPAEQVATTPPVGILFAAFLGYNPMAELLGPDRAHCNSPASTPRY